LVARSSAADSGSPNKAQHLRRLIGSPEIVIMPGVYDGFSARLVERRGYSAAFISGAGLSESKLGQPDVGLMGLSENVAWTADIAACTNVPLIADADTGYGSVVNVFHAVRAFEKTGVAGIMIEDQVWPKRCGHLPGKEVIEAEEMVSKIGAAIAARDDPDFVVVARTDAVAPLGLHEAIQRAEAYAKAGADVLFADALLSEVDIETFCRSVSAPVMVNMGFGIRRRKTTPLLSPLEVQQMGAAAVIVPRLLSAAAVRGMINALDAFDESVKSGAVVERPDLSVGFEELNELVGWSEFVDLERRFSAKS
jgi:2-methylisocitrate lyase-like PEP mutase family enzyme